MPFTLHAVVLKSKKAVVYTFQNALAGTYFAHTPLGGSIV